MVKHNPAARPMVGCALLSLAALATAQTQPQSPPGSVILQSQRTFPLTAAGEAEPQASQPVEKDAAGQPKQNAVVSGFFSSGGNVLQAAPGGGQKYFEEQREKLRQQLADPKQRAKLHAQRVETVRGMNTELARVLRLDAKTEERLFSLLADQYLESEIQNPFASMTSVGTATSPRKAMGSRQAASSSSQPNRGLMYDNFTKDQALAYTRSMEQISKVIGAARLDDYVDYQQSLVGRMLVQQFDATLAAENKLQPDQKDAMAAIFAEDMKRQIHTSRPFGLQGFGTLRMEESPEERQKRMQLWNLAANEDNLSQAEISNRDLEYRFAPLLTPEQAKAFAALQQQQLQTQRNWTQQMRRNLGLGPDEKIDALTGQTAQAPILSSNLQLDVTLRINDVEVSKTLISKRGSSVTLAGPEGLQVELRPYLVDSDSYLMLELKVYEPVRGGRRLVSESASSAQITNPRKGPASHLGMSGGGGSVAQGRKGYAVNWSASATYL